MAGIRSLRRQNEFKETYGKGAKSVGHLIVVYLMDSTENEMAVVASRKVGNAVRRNRAKRLMREAVHSLVFNNPEETARILRQTKQARRTEHGDNEEKDGLRVVLIARAAIKTAKSQDVCRELEDLLSQPGKCRQHSIR